jgi:lipoyl(octanoyl) transferase
MGARGGRATVLAPADALGAPLFDVERGGDITWHGPGQLVAYPILHLRRRGVRAAGYVRRLEATLLATLDAFGVRGEVMPGRPGVWVAGAKVAALGVSIRGGVSLHGIALNVAPDLAWFDSIVPCGIAGAGVTSLDRIGVRATVSEVAEAFAAAFVREFGVALVAADPATLTEAVPA